MKIYPKTNEYLEGIENLLQYIKKSKGLEIQYFEKDNTEIVDFKMEDAIRKVCKMCPEIKEITVHPPLSNYELELQLIKNPNIFLNNVKEIVKLSKKYGVTINLLEHTRLTYFQQRLVFVDTLKKALKILDKSNSKVLFENIYMMEEKENCSVIEICNYMNNEHLMACIDLCHLYCQSKIYYQNINEFIKNYLDKNKCKKWVHQVHFAFTKNNDGYVDRSTHAVVHENKEQLVHDLEMLKTYNLDKCNWIIEIAEEDYKARYKQIQDIKWLYEITENEYEN